MESKYGFSVCPHDTAKNSTGWFFLNTYLQRQLGCGMHFEPKDNFIKEREDVLAGGYHIVYANPFSAGVFHRQLGFIPVARPIGVFDEAVLVRNANQAMPTKRPVKIASATDKLIIHQLGLSLLAAQGIAIADCEFEFVGTHVKAAHAVIQGKADLGFIFNETWDGMSQSSKESLSVVSQTESKQAFHCFCISAELSDKRNQLQAILCGMKDDPKGQKILVDMQFPAGFEPVNISEFDAVLQLMV
jgi:phosphonate transport system substrate-binding protein